MARHLMAALRLGGHDVHLASALRAYLKAPEQVLFSSLRDRARAEVSRLAQRWREGRPPDLWFSYHPYHKAPDLIGPPLCDRFAVPYVTAEASYSPSRDASPWGEIQRQVVAAVRLAAVNICLTRRDYEGLARVVDPARLAMLSPFIAAEGPGGEAASAPDGHGAACGTSGGAPTIVTVGMMRSGDKLASYRLLAAALARLLDIPWQLAIVGDGPERTSVEAAFAAIPAQRIVWHGEVGPEYVPRRLAAADIYAWPGTGEGFGLAYLEAQAMGLPAVAQDTAGVPAVVRHGTTGLLTPAGDVDAFAAALRTLLGDADLRTRLGRQARRFVQEERSLPKAAGDLDAILCRAVGQPHPARP